jgi:EAL domain-containing protein (putative c-di-GMP-specific phosphodiesterase class I)
VVQRVCRQIRLWLDRGLEVPRIAVNLSPLQLREPDLVPRLLDALASQRLQGRHLAIEITEAALTADDTVLRQRLQALREAGVQIAIDDFGTGRSSLAALRRLPVDGLKIDRSFVADLDGDGAAICSAIVGLAHTLGLRVVAEGIETDAQLDFLRRLGCDEFQGHVLAPALGATTLGEVLAGANIQHRIPPAPTLPTQHATHPSPLPQRLPLGAAVRPAAPSVKPTVTATQPTAPAPRRTGSGRPKSTLAGWPATQLDHASTLSRLF